MILDEDASNAFQEVMKMLLDEQEEFWAGLSKEDQLKVFCCVVRRLAKGELEDKRSYRGILYNTFGFGPEAYAQAQEAGFLSLHNAIFDVEEFHTQLTKFCRMYNIDNAEDKVDDFIMETV